MSEIYFNKVFLDFPIYSDKTRSLKNKVYNIATGGVIKSTSDHKVSVTSLCDVNFELREGDRVALLGHNGAGKSTLLRLLSGVYHPTSGEIKVEGSIGSLIDISLGIDGEATGRENIFLRAALLGIKRRFIEEKLNDIIDFSELGEFIDLPVRTYSSGMHLRLAFAVSTIIRPDILLMDEWLSVGDDSFRIKAEKRLEDVIKSSSILVIATHSRDLALKSCNRAIWLEHGKIILDSTPEHVCSLYFKG